MLGQLYIGGVCIVFLFAAVYFVHLFRTIPRDFERRLNRALWPLVRSYPTRGDDERDDLLFRREK